MGRKVGHSKRIAGRVTGRRVVLLRRTHHAIVVFQLNVAVLIVVERALRAFVHETGVRKLEAVGVERLLPEILHLLLGGNLRLLVGRVELRDWLESKTIVAVVPNIRESCSTHHLVFVGPCLTLVLDTPRLVLDELRFVGREFWCVVDVLGVVHVTKQRTPRRVAVTELERTRLRWCLSPGAVVDILGSHDNSIVVWVVVGMVRVVEDADRLLFDDLLEAKVHDGLVGGGSARCGVVRVWSISVKVQTIHDRVIKRFEEE